MQKSFPFDRAYPFAVFFSHDKEHYFWFNAFETRKAAIRIARAGIDSDANANFAIVIDMRNKSTVRKMQSPTLRFYMRIHPMNNTQNFPLGPRADLHIDFSVSGKKEIAGQVIDLINDIDSGAQDAIRRKIIDASNDASGLTEEITSRIAVDIVAEKLSIDPLHFDIRCEFIVKRLQNEENEDGE